MRSNSSQSVVVIGAGIGGLTTAAALARQGVPVTVLEAHVYPGGCAGTFYHQGYRFDAGATLAGGFYPGGPMDLLARAVGVDTWPTLQAEHVMSVHFPGGHSFPVLAGEDRWQARRGYFGVESLSFWRWQEATADLLWDLALRSPDWPPQTYHQTLKLASSGWSWLTQNKVLPSRFPLVLDIFRPVAAHLNHAPEAMRLFIDAQLLISAQTTSQRANALFGAAALDLPRRGVVHLTGGMGAIANELVKAIQKNGGRVLYRQEAICIETNRARPVAVHTRRGYVFPALQVVANLSPWSIDNLLAAVLPPVKPGPEHSLIETPYPPDGWGAFMLYLGVDSSLFQPGTALHHQVILREPLGEGNSVFISVSPKWDPSRAPEGRRAVTISTHTRLQPWWELYHEDRQAYRALKDEYTQRLLYAAESIFPNFHQALDLLLPGTPVTFQRFTRRASGWVGGFPQTNLFRSYAPRRAPGIWMVGDSIFPGQSIPAAALGGLRVSADILHELDRSTRNNHRGPSI